MDYEKFKPKKYHETKDIIIAWLAISICFLFVLGGYTLFNKGLISDFTLSEFLTFLVLSLVVTGTSFILHELAHKYSAIHFGAKAMFVRWNSSLIFSVILAFLAGFVLVAPGAVYIFGKRLSVKQDGIVSLAGPVTNIIMGLIFLGLGFLGIPGLIVSYGMFINFWIAGFNLLPFGPLDGKKIFIWNPAIWVVTMAIPVLFIFVL